MAEGLLIGPSTLIALIMIFSASVRRKRFFVESPKMEGRRIIPLNSILRTECTLRLVKS
jgi:hypothetical protein